MPAFRQTTEVGSRHNPDRNPRTGAEIAIPASKAPKFRPGATLKAAVDSNGKGG